MRSIVHFHKQEDSENTKERMIAQHSSSNINRTFMIQEACKTKMMPRKVASFTIIIALLILETLLLIKHTSEVELYTYKLKIMPFFLDAMSAKAKLFRQKKAFRSGYPGLSVHIGKFS